MVDRLVRSKNIDAEDSNLNELNIVYEELDDISNDCIDDLWNSKCGFKVTAEGSWYKQLDQEWKLIGGENYININKPSYFIDSRKGNDKNNGTKLKPFKTIKGAFSYLNVKQIVWGTPNVEIHFILRGTPSSTVGEAYEYSIEGYNGFQTNLSIEAYDENNYESTTIKYERVKLKIGNTPFNISHGRLEIFGLTLEIDTNLISGNINSFITASDASVLNFNFTTIDVIGDNPYLSRDTSIILAEQGSKVIFGNWSEGFTTNVNPNIINVNNHVDTPLKINSSSSLYHDTLTINQSLNTVNNNNGFVFSVDRIKGDQFGNNKPSKLQNCVGFYALTGGGGIGGPTNITSPDTSLTVGGSGYERTIITKEPLPNSTISKENGNYNVKVDNTTIKKNTDGTLYAEQAAAGVPEAPTDGKQYGRQSKTWTEVIKENGLYLRHTPLPSTPDTTVEIDKSSLQYIVGNSNYSIGSLIYDLQGTIGYILGEEDLKVLVRIISDSVGGGGGGEGLDQLEVYLVSDGNLLTTTIGATSTYKLNQLTLMTPGLATGQVASLIYDIAGTVAYIRANDETRQNPVIITLATSEGTSLSNPVEVYYSDVILNTSINQGRDIDLLSLHNRIGSENNYTKGSIVYDSNGTTGYIQYIDSGNAKASVITSSKVGDSGGVGYEPDNKSIILDEGKLAVQLKSNEPGFKNILDKDENGIFVPEQVDSIMLGFTEHEDGPIQHPSNGLLKLPFASSGFTSLGVNELLGGDDLTVDPIVFPSDTASSGVTKYLAIVSSEFHDTSRISLLISFNNSYQVVSASTYFIDQASTPERHFIKGGVLGDSFETDYVKWDKATRQLKFKSDVSFLFYDTLLTNIDFDALPWLRFEINYMDSGIINPDSQSINIDEGVIEAKISSKPDNTLSLVTDGLFVPSNGSSDIIDIEVYIVNAGNRLTTTIGGNTTYNRDQITLMTPGLPLLQKGSIVYDLAGTIGYIRSTIDDFTANIITLSTSESSTATDSLDVFYSDVALNTTINQGRDIDLSSLHNRTQATLNYNIGSIVYDNSGTIGYIEYVDEKASVITSSKVGVSSGSGYEPDNESITLTEDDKLTLKVKPNEPGFRNILSKDDKGSFVPEQVNSIMLGFTEHDDGPIQYPSNGLVKLPLAGTSTLSTSLRFDELLGGDILTKNPITFPDNISSGNTSKYLVIMSNEAFNDSYNALQLSLDDSERVVSAFTYFKSEFSTPLHDFIKNGVFGDSFETDYARWDRDTRKLYLKGNITYRDYIDTDYNINFDKLDWVKFEINYNDNGLINPDSQSMNIDEGIIEAKISPKQNNALSLVTDGLFVPTSDAGSDDNALYSSSDHLNTTVDTSYDIQTNSLTFIAGNNTYPIGSLIYDINGTLASIESLNPTQNTATIKIITKTGGSYSNNNTEVYKYNLTLNKTINANTTINKTDLELQTTLPPTYAIGSIIYDLTGSIGFIRSVSTDQVIATTTSIVGAGSVSDPIEVFYSIQDLNTTVNQGRIILKEDIIKKVGEPDTSKYTKGSIVYDKNGTIGYIQTVTSQELIVITSSIVGSGGSGEGQPTDITSTDLEIGGSDYNRTIKIKQQNTNSSIKQLQGLFETKIDGQTIVKGEDGTLSAIAGGSVAGITEASFHVATELAIQEVFPSD